jgi:hypothetical protein
MAGMMNGTSKYVPAVETKSKDVLFTRDTRCIVYGMQNRAVQLMLDFDHMCGRPKPSVCGLVHKNPCSV